jgi:hypothetical protein
MNKRRLWIVSLSLLVLGLVLVPAAFANEPQEFTLCFDWADPPYAYCWASPDLPLFTGCVVQPQTPGRAAHGIFYRLPDYQTQLLPPDHPDFYSDGTCEYNLATYAIPGKNPGRPEYSGDAHVTMNRCTGALEGMYVQGTGPLGEFCVTMKYHYGPEP